MPILTGGKWLEGTRRGTKGNVAPQRGDGGHFNSPGVPANGFLNATAPPGSLCLDTATGNLYQNTGTQAATVWTLLGATS